MDALIQNAIDAVSFGSLYALFALGIALSFGIMGLINFAHGELIMVGGYALVFLGNPSWPVLVLGVLVIVVAFALATERIAFRPVRSADAITLLVTSFAVSYFLQSLAQVVVGSIPKTANLWPALAESWQVGEINIPKLNVVIVAVTLELMVLLGLFLRRTRLGIQIRAEAEDF